jgi:hypothetical protein
MRKTTSRLAAPSGTDRADRPTATAAFPNIVVYHLRDNGVVPDVPGGFLPLVSKTFSAIGKGALSRLPASFNRTIEPLSWL